MQGFVYTFCGYTNTCITLRIYVNSFFVIIQTNAGVPNNFATWQNKNDAILAVNCTWLENLKGAYNVYIPLLRFGCRIDQLECVQFPSYCFFFCNLI